MHHLVLCSPVTSLTLPLSLAVLRATVAAGELHLGLMLLDQGRGMVVKKVLEMVIPAVINHFLYRKLRTL
jgi:hypothetical protein